VLKLAAAVAAASVMGALGLGLVSMTLHDDENYPPVLMVDWAGAAMLHRPPMLVSGARWVYIYSCASFVCIRDPLHIPGYPDIDLF
jgi:hypothetical protein